MKCAIILYSTFSTNEYGPKSKQYRPLVDHLVDHFVCKYPICYLGGRGRGCSLVVTCHPRRDSASTITIICVLLFTTWANR